MNLTLINTYNFKDEEVNIKNEINKFNFDYSNQNLKNFENELDNIIYENKMDLDEEYK